MHAFWFFFFAVLICVKREGPLFSFLFYYSFFLLLERPNRKELQPHGCFLFIHIDATNVNREIKGERESGILENN